MRRSDLSAIADLTLDEIALIASQSIAWKTAGLPAGRLAPSLRDLPMGVESKTVIWGNGTSDVTYSLNGVDVARLATDLGGNYSWSLRAWVLDTAGRVRQDVTQYDDGRLRIDTLNEAGMKMQRVVFDGDGYKTFTYHETGKMKTIFERYQDGREMTITFDETGRKTGELHMDVTDQFDWAVQMENFNSDGKHTSALRIDDDGMQWRWDYNGRGEVIEKTYDDFGDRWSWTQKYWQYDDEGVIQAHRISHDDGAQTVMTFDEGRKVRRESVDAANTLDWQTEITLYDQETGKARERQKLEDDGDWRQWRYGEDGKLAAYYRADASDSKSWDSIYLEYDETGAPSFYRRIMDDGRVIELGEASVDPFLTQDYALLT
ncbi:hypothetical protein JANAI62_28520 [Jannaschia pagri]|uniref:YD repeat-containing protein n=1 Tax=Jannaschia pagri TaxID=2829797 RepID=A0ABQ4NP86_9RHOB|nr:MULTISPECIES: hypothetical protein [unclassified Jannaschia]GIT92394.1 hypothetical protein JANAI61_28520 [Jannaschia sp. AI_61]GIT96229.1 hypothetical protein JANAI62_28520 [Jannaschia sp. AI_62]